MLHADEAEAQNPDAGDDQLADLLWKLGGSVRRDPSLNWRQTREWCNGVLSRAYEASPASQRLVCIFGKRGFERGGAEHLILAHPDFPGRYFKTTYGGAFGCRTRLYARDEQAIFFHAESNDDPAFYLHRWRILNSLSDYNTRIEGVLPPQESGGLYRICVSQPAVPADNPTATEIEVAFTKVGFCRVCENVFYSEEDNILLTDAAPRNVRIFQGWPIPFDAIAEHPEGETLEWIRRRAGL